MCRKYQIFRRTSFKKEGTNMFAYLVQHGEPLPEEVNPDRPLSDKGKSDVLNVASFVTENMAVKVGAIYHSTKIRAKETAGILDDYFEPPKGAAAVDNLDPLANPAIWADRLNAAAENIMLAGHLPHLSRLASLLVTGDETATTVSFQMGGMVCLEKTDDGSWSVAWMIIPQMLG
ncbi:phosphohistidine phosphatase SixA [Candidatus Latescibacterota bacterium]